MKKYIIILVFLFAVINCSTVKNDAAQKTESSINNTNSSKTINKENMKLGAFSVSLAVKDLTVSKKFYEDLGFVEFGGGMEKNYLIMKNGETLIGLFQGMFEGNILTFNPGWDQSAQNMESFDDIRTIQKNLKSKGVNFDLAIDESKTSGPASFMISDPDGNVILFDQHR